jgi:hypothetical protein
LILLAVFWIVAWFLPNNTLMETLRLVQISVGLAVVTSYAPIALGAIWSKYKPDRLQQLGMGIALGFLALVLQGAWTLLWRLSSQPYWMANADIVGFFAWMSILAGTLHITAPGAIDGTVPKRNWILLGISIGVGFLSTGLIIFYSPDFHLVADWLRPIFAETSLRHP